MITPLRKITDKQLGEVLVDKGLITQEQLNQVVRIQKEKGGLLGEILIALDYVKEKDMVWALGLQKGLAQKGQHKLIGELLVEKGLINGEQLSHALAVQKQKGGLIGSILVALGYVTETDIALALTSQYGFPYLPLDSYEIDAEVVKLIPENVARQYQVIPIDKFGNNLSVAMSNPLNDEAIEDIQLLIGGNVQIFVSTSSDINKALDKYHKKAEK